MLLRKSIFMFILFLIVLLVFSGCTVNDREIQTADQHDGIDADRMEEIYDAVYEIVRSEDISDELEWTRSIVQLLGEQGYVAVDNANQVNMTRPEQVMEFCGRVDAGDEAELTVTVVS